MVPRRVPQLDLRLDQRKGHKWASLMDLRWDLQMVPGTDRKLDTLLDQEMAPWTAPQWVLRSD
jgi:hypothetical protein